MIPDEAVEAAWWAMPKESYVDSPEHVRAMLEAAAPHLIAAHFRQVNANAIAQEIENPLQFKRKHTNAV